MESLESVLAQFAPAIGRIAASYEANEHIREELIQDITLAIWQSLSRFKANGSIKSYVLRIAHNRGVDHVTRELRRPKSSENESDTLAHSDTLERNTLLNQQQLQLFRAIRKLSLPLRQVITLLLEDMSYKEIADTLDIELNTVGIRVNRAKKQLKGLMNNEG